MEKHYETVNPVAQLRAFIKSWREDGRYLRRMIINAWKKPVKEV